MMIPRLMFKRYVLLLVTAGVFLIWFGQQYNVDNNPLHDKILTGQQSDFDDTVGIDIGKKINSASSEDKPFRDLPRDDVESAVGSKDLLGNVSDVDDLKEINVKSSAEQSEENRVDIQERVDSANPGHSALSPFRPPIDSRSGGTADESIPDVFMKVNNTLWHAQENVTQFGGVVVDSNDSGNAGSSVIASNQSRFFNYSVPNFDQQSYGKRTLDAESRGDDHGSKIIFLGTTPSTPKIRQEVADYDAKANLILVQKFAQKNFVEHEAVDADHHHEHGHRSDLSVDHQHKSNYKPEDTRTKFDSLPKQQVRKKPGIGDKSKFNEPSELDSFAQIQALPDYDLPILENKKIADTDKAHPIVPEASGVNNRPYGTVDNFPAVDNSSSTFSSNNQDADVDNGDDVMSSAVILGVVNPNRTYAVFSTTTENREALNFIFLLPLTAMAWKRIGFDSIVIIVGSIDTWNSDELFHFVLSSVRELGAIVVFLEPRPEKSVMISQVSRIFIANILRAHSTVHNRRNPGLIDNVYIITTDTDIWPIYGDVYKLPPGKDILSLNSECCSPFSHRDVTYRMLPMANVGMRVGIWRKLTHRFGESPRSVDDILTSVVREFGPVALRPVHKGDNIGWFLDQMMISILIASWTAAHGAERVKFIPRDVGVDRLDRNWWGPGVSGGIEDRIDAHLLQNAYLPGVWAQLVPLLRALYGGETDRYIWCTRYYDSFERFFVTKYRAGGGRLGDG